MCVYIYNHFTLGKKRHFYAPDEHPRLQEFVKQLITPSSIHVTAAAAAAKSLQSC